jgi:hypothetical protein
MQSVSSHSINFLCCLLIANSLKLTAKKSSVGSHGGICAVQGKHEKCSQNFIPEISKQQSCGKLRSNCEVVDWFMWHPIGTGSDILCTWQ